MKVLVTGGAGSVGSAVVTELLARGHEVTVCGRREQVETPAAYRQLDMTDFAAVVETLRGFERVVHLAAVPSPGGVPDSTLFDINVRGTYHLYEACAEVGISQVATASSINALGNLFGVRRIAVHYFPLDEAHPAQVSDVYSLSKQLTEELGQYAWDRWQIANVSLRIPAVLHPSTSDRRANWLRRVREQRQVTTFWQDFWCVVDARDSARAFALGIEVPYTGAHTLFINDRVNALGLPSRELAAACYPQVTDFREPLAGCEALISCQRAKDLLGWEPQHSWAELHPA
ncbi:MAG: NAD(P)-dependent oxidoreductase [Fimbriimonadaceae bacterium]|nr:NAD(P)-dependent oxidoreductase [Fimbriimonadaceae bacterium]